MGFRYRPRWEREFVRSSAGRAAFGGIAKAIEKDTRAEVKRLDTLKDVPAREYLRGLKSEPTDRGARVFTTAPRAHFVEWGTLYRAPRAPMRTAARRFGRFVER